MTKSEAQEMARNIEENPDYQLNGYTIMELLEYRAEVTERELAHSAATGEDVCIKVPSYYELDLDYEMVRVLWETRND